MPQAIVQWPKLVTSEGIVMKARKRVIKQKIDKDTTVI